MRYYILHFSLLLIFIFTYQGHAQTITMTNGGNDQTCSGTFYDPGGTGNYAGGSSTMVHTICTDTPGEYIQAVFTAFDLWSNSCVWDASVDRLRIYDGPNTSSPLIANYRDNQGLGAYVIGISGCLTFEFTRQDKGGWGCASNSGAPGWVANISCIDEFPETGERCFEALPFCSDQSYYFPNSTSGSAPSGPDYGCLGSQPAPVWYYLKIGDSGPIELSLSQENNNGGGIDIDFAMWGPFTDIPTGCTQIMSGNLAPIQCSYSADPTETIGIGMPGGYGGGSSTPPAAQTGEYYILLLTNYSQQAGYISLEQTGGTGSTDCSIVTPCSIDNFVANVSACTNDLYSVQGTIEISDPPSTGDLVVEDCNGNQIIVASAPFTSTSYTYNLTNLNANGSPCSVEAYFTDDTHCSETFNYTAPSCSTPPNTCDAQVGTYTITTDGTQNNQEITLCYGQSFNFTHNGDFTPPADISSPTVAYNPGIYWVVYSCPPSVGTTPTIGIDINDDPCLVGVISSSDISDMNDMSFINSFPQGTFTDNMVYFVPLTMYDITTGHYTVTQAGDTPCYDLGTPIIVNYLPEITTNAVPDCQAGTVSITISGGSPEINGTQFTLSNLSPSTASFSTTSVGHNGTVIISGLQDGDSYSFDIVDDYNCTANSSGTFQGVSSSDFIYNDTQFCPDDANPTPVVSGLNGGSFTANLTGIELDINTGTIDLANSTPGEYTITYTSPDAPCNSSTDFVITINPFPTSTFQVDEPAGCSPHAVEFTSNTSSTDNCFWDFGDGTTSTDCGTVSHVYTQEGEYTVSLSVSSIEGCESQNTITDYIQVVETPEAIFIAQPTTVSVSNTEVEFINESNGTSDYIWDFGDSSLNVNDEHPIHNFPNETTGVYEVTLYAINGQCIDSSTVLITVIDPAIDYEIPNIFTPNGDGNNDFFKIINPIGVETFSVIILNRWGNVVFESDDINFLWNGKIHNSGDDCIDGVYFYKMKFTDYFNSTFEEHGYVHLSR